MFLMVGQGLIFIGLRPIVLVAHDLFSGTSGFVISSSDPHELFGHSPLKQSYLACKKGIDRAKAKVLQRSNDLSLHVRGKSHPGFVAMLICQSCLLLIQSI